MRPANLHEVEEWRRRAAGGRNPTPALSLGKLKLARQHGIYRLVVMIIAVTITLTITLGGAHYTALSSPSLHQAPTTAVPARVVISPARFAGMAALPEEPAAGLLDAAESDDQSDDGASNDGASNDGASNDDASSDDAGSTAMVALTDISTSSAAILVLGDDAAPRPRRKLRPVFFSPGQAVVTRSSQNIPLPPKSSGDGQLVFSWGLGLGPRVGRQSDPFDDQAIPGPLTTALPSGVVSASARQHSLLLTGDGRLFAFGEDHHGRLGVSSLLNSVTDQDDGQPPAEIWEPVQADSGQLASRRLLSVSAGLNHGIAATFSGEVHTWGSNRHGQLGLRSDDPPRDARAFPASRVRYDMLDQKIMLVAAGPGFSLAVTDAGKLFTWGWNCYNGKTNPSVARHVGGALEGAKVVALSAGFAHWACITDDGQVYTALSLTDAFGEPIEDDEQGSLLALGRGGDPRVPLPVGGPLANKVVVSVATGRSFTVAVTEDGTVYSWGVPSSDVLGRGVTEGDEGVPGKVWEGGIKDKLVVGVSAGEYFSLAWTADGELFAWGDNMAHGQTGLGRSGSGGGAPETPTVHVPTRVVRGLEGYRVILAAAGTQHALAVVKRKEGWEPTVNSDSVSVSMLPTADDPATGDDVTAADGDSTGGAVDNGSSGVAEGDHAGDAAASVSSMDYGSSASDMGDGSSSAATSAISASGDSAASQYSTNLADGSALAVSAGDMIASDGYAGGAARTVADGGIATGDGAASYPARDDDAAAAAGGTPAPDHSHGSVSDTAQGPSQGFSQEDVLQDPLQGSYSSSGGLAQDDAAEANVAGIGETPVIAEEANSSQLDSAGDAPLVRVASSQHGSGASAQQKPLGVAGKVPKVAGARAEPKGAVAKDRSDGVSGNGATKTGKGKGGDAAEGTASSAFSRDPMSALVAEDAASSAVANHADSKGGKVKVAKGAVTAAGVSSVSSVAAPGTDHPGSGALKASSVAASGQGAIASWPRATSSTNWNVRPLPLDFYDAAELAKDAASKERVDKIIYDGMPPAETIAGVDPDLFHELPDQFDPNFKSPCWYAKADSRYTTPGTLLCLPYFHILGVSKCGTTDMYHRLSLHPDVYESRNKGPHWWDEGKQGLKWYMDLYKYSTERIAQAPSVGIVGDASSNTLTYNGVAVRGKRLKSVSVAEVMRLATPDVKLIAIFRNPVDRLYSSYYYYNNYKVNPNPNPTEFHASTVKQVELMNRCMEAHTAAFCAHQNYFNAQQLIKGMFSVYLPAWCEVFPREQLLVLRMEHYSKNTKDELVRVMDFLGMRMPTEVEWPKILEMKTKNTREANNKGGTGASGPMLPETRELLERFYRPFNEQLAAMLGDPGFMWNPM